MHIKYLSFFLFLLISQSLWSQHDSLFHNYQLGVKFGPSYTLTETQSGIRTSSMMDANEILHEIGPAESDYGWNIGVFGLYRINDWLNIQAEIDLFRSSARFAYNTSTRTDVGNDGGREIVENTYTDDEETTGTGNYELKELKFQIPIMAKAIFGEGGAARSWKFAIGAGAYFSGGGFSNSTWTYDQRQYYRQIAGNWAPEVEGMPLLNPAVSEKTKLVSGSNFGFLVDVAAIKPITKTQSVFLEFRYQRPFKEESEIPYFEQQHLVASIGFMTRILRPNEEEKYQPDDGFGEDEELLKEKKREERKKKREQEEKDDFDDF